MHNGCLLLLAFVAVFQPIASYTERVNGRQQRCDYRTSLRDPGVYFHGSYRFTKPAVEDRRLNQREDTREDRRNEVRDEALRTASSPERRLSDSLERHESILTRSARIRIDNEAVLRRQVRDTRLTGDRDQRNRETRRERLSRVQDTDRLQRSNRQITRRVSENESRYQSSIDTKRSNEPRVSQQDIRRYGNNAASQRVTQRETREGDDVANRLDERRITRDQHQRMAMRRSESRIQLARNADREILQRHSREFQSSVMSSDRVNRAYDERSRTVSRDDTRSRDGDNRRISSRRSSDQQRQIRDISPNQRQRLSNERRDIDEMTTRRNRDLNDRIVENRRNTEPLRRVRSVESRGDKRNTERNARLTRAVRSADERFTQNDGRGSRMLEGERSVEIRKVVRDARSMDRIRSLERSGENRRNARSTDRARVLGIRRDIRNIERESQRNTEDKRVTETRRVVRNIEKDSDVLERNARATEIRNKRDTCAFGRDRSVLMRERMFVMERAAEPSRESRTERFDRAVTNQRDTSNVERLLSRGRERVSESRRDLRFTDRARSMESRRAFRTDVFPVIRAERTDESRRNFESRLFGTESQREARNLESTSSRRERSSENRGVRNMVSRVSRSERTSENRRDIGGRESRTFRAARTNEDRRDTRNVEFRALRFLNRVADYRRDSRNNERDGRVIERTSEMQRNERTSEIRRDMQHTEKQSRTADERVIDYRRASRSLERDSQMGARERSAETNSNRRTVARNSRTSVFERLSEGRRERVTDNRRDVRNVRGESRLLDTSEDRRVDSRAMNLFGSRIDLDDRKNERVTRLNKRDLLDSRPSRTLRESRSETRRESERHSFARQREFQSVFKNPVQIVEDNPQMNWQYMLYTLQAVYVCGILMQFMNERSAGKKTRHFWWSAPQHLIKVD